MSVAGSASATGSVAPSPLPADALAGSRVLVVEDETIVSFMLETLLLRSGCREIWHAAGVDMALQRLCQASPDAAVLDVNLGDQLVYPVAERLAALQVPFVFATGYHHDRLPERWRQRPVLQKPYHGSALVTMLSMTLVDARAAV